MWHFSPRGWGQEQGEHWLSFTLKVDLLDFFSKAIIVHSRLCQKRKQYYEFSYVPWDGHCSLPISLILCSSSLLIQQALILFGHLVSTHPGKANCSSESQWILPSQWPHFSSCDWFEDKYMALFLPKYVGRILLCLWGTDLQPNKRHDVPGGNPSVPTSFSVNVLSCEEAMTARVAVVNVYHKGDNLREE